MRNILLMACFVIGLQLAGCQQTSNNDDSGQQEVPNSVLDEKTVLTDITLANGQKVSTCAQYTKARASHLIMETITNNIVANEYLPCSLINTNLIDELEAQIIAKQMLALRVRQMPLSIAQMYGRKTLFLEAGFNQLNDKLLWSTEQHNVLIQVKAKATDADNRYLIWVLDVISDGNYYAYYPAWVEISPTSSTMKVFPVYQSGY